VKPDYSEAARWYRQAAEQGQPEAEYNLGVLYTQGLGVSQDYRQAAHWYRLAAERGQSDAQLNLAALYAAGRGVAQDYIAAYRWLELAAASGASDAAEAKERISSRLTAAELQQAQAEAARWKPCTVKAECEARFKP
jgi:TPR repeat protein